MADSYYLSVEPNSQPALTATVTDTAMELDLPCWMPYLCCCLSKSMQRNLLSSCFAPVYAIVGLLSGGASVFCSYGGESRARIIAGVVFVCISVLSGLCLFVVSSFRTDTVQTGLKAVQTDVKALKTTMDTKFTKIDGKLDKMDGKFTTLQTDVDKKFAAMDRKLDILIRNSMVKPIQSRTVEEGASE